MATDTLNEEVVYEALEEVIDPELGLDFVSLANPRWFAEDPTLAWGFYGHRLDLYRRTRPHAGFAILRAWSSRMRRGGFVFTSNVDGHFQRSGFPEEQVAEVHGSFDGMQCTGDCDIGIERIGCGGDAPSPDDQVVGGLGHCSLLGDSSGKWDHAGRVTVSCNP